MEKPWIGTFWGLYSLKCSRECHPFMQMKSKLLTFRDELFDNIMNNELELPDEVSPQAKDLLIKVSLFLHLAVAEEPREKARI